MSQSVSEAAILSVGVEKSAVAQADFVDVGESDLSWPLAVCCLLSVTFPNTTAYFSAVTADEKTWRKKEGRLTHCPDFINQPELLLYFWLHP